MVNGEFRFLRLAPNCSSAHWNTVVHERRKSSLNWFGRRYGDLCGVLSNEHPYRDRKTECHSGQHGEV
jgi:hypothetical protein